MYYFGVEIGLPGTRKTIGLRLLDMKLSDGKGTILVLKSLRSRFREPGNRAPLKQN